MEGSEEKQSNQNNGEPSVQTNSTPPSTVGLGDGPGEAAKFINSRMHDYARDSLQRFAILFSMGSVAISLLFLSAVQMFLKYPIERLNGNVWGWCYTQVMAVRVVGLILMCTAIFAFLFSLWKVFIAFQQLHAKEPIERDETTQNNGLAARWQNDWNYVTSKLNLKGINEIATNVKHKSFNILRAPQIASYKNHDEFIGVFAELFGTKTKPAQLSKVVESTLKDTYRIVQRSLVLDCKYFVAALFGLFVSFAIICLADAALFAGVCFINADKPFARGAVGMRNLMLAVDREFINLDIYEPFSKSGDTKFPTLIIVPGGRGKNYVVNQNTAARFTGYDDLASELARRGFYSVVFDGRGQGKSEGLRSHQNGLLDLQKVIDFTSELPEVDSKNIGVFGRCGGGAVSLHQATKDSRIKSVMTWGMPPCFDEFDKNEIKQRLLHAGVRLKKGTTFLNGEDAALCVCQPLLVAGGTEDTKWFFINENAKRQLEMIEAISKRGASKKIRFEVLRGAPHGIDSKHKCFEQFVDLVSEWFQDTLK